MQVEKLVADERLRTRTDLIQIMDAAAEYLASRDTDPYSHARALWKLWSAPSGETFIGLQLDDEGYSTARNFTPNQLVPADIRELRLLSLWNDVLSKRTWREFERVNELIRQYRED
jgi:hypothetical protein